MKTNYISPGIIAGILMTASLFALEELRSSSEWRSSSETAIGQLEDISGQQIQRPSSSQTRPSTIRNYKHYTPPQRAQKRPVQRPSNSAMTAFNTGMTILNILDSIDSSQQQAQAQAQAQAQWLAEQQRIIEEQRQQALRVMTAQRLRSFWDNADSSMSDSLSGALAMPGQGTNFFGASPQPNPGAIGNILSAPMDLPAVDLTAPSMPGAIPVPPLPDPTPTPHAEVAMSGQAEPMPKPDVTIKEVTQALSRDALGTVKKYTLKALPSEWQAELIVEHGEKMDRFIGNFFKSMDSERIVPTLGHGSTEDHRRLLKDLRRIDREASMLVYPKSPVDAEGLELLREWLEQRKMNLKQVGDMVVNGTRQAVVEKQIDRLMWGNQ